MIRTTSCAAVRAIAVAAVVIGGTFGFAGCYAPLAGTGSGNVSMTLNMPPGMIETMQNGQAYVARFYVVNAAYEMLLRRVTAYDDFLDVFYYTVLMREFDGYPELLQNYLHVESTMDDLDEDLILKAPVMFGGKPYYDILVSEPASGGAVTLPGVPSGRAYLIYVEFWLPGTEDNEDADPVYETVVWAGADPYEDILVGHFDENMNLPRNLGDDDAAAVIKARDIFSQTLDAFTDRKNYPIIEPVYVRDGHTAVLELILREYPAVTELQ